MFGLLPSEVLAGQRRDWERVEEMILWTMQSPQAWAELEVKGVLRAKRQHLMEERRLGAYQLARKMRSHIGPPTEPDCLPIWAWRQK